jgi:two-component system heavy metal sensor histidine kinase CusS
MRPASITFRLSLSVAVLCTAALVAVSFYLYDTLERHFAERAAAELAGKVDLFRHILSSLGSRDEVVARQPRLREALFGNLALHVTLFDRNRELLFATSRLRLPEAQLRSAVPASVAPEATGVWQAAPGQRFRTFVAWAELAPGAGEQVLIALALDTAEEQAALSVHRQHVMLALALAVVAVPLLGFAIARRSLRPLRDMAGTVHRISAEHLSERLDEARVPSELSRLAAGFNAMLARLEESFGRLASFSSDLAHELRTPIQNLLGQTQVALTRTRAAAEYREVLESNLEEYQRLARMTEDMLFLARADHAQAALQTESLDLRVELDKVAEFYEPLAEERGVTVDCAGAGAVSADRAMVQRAIGNLLSNAVRHTERGGRIEARVGSADDGSMRLSIGNPGPGIAAEHRAHIFDRFYRIDDTRNGAHGGHGLGLAIVRSIMRLHGGEVTLESVPGHVTTFTLRFPGGGAKSPHGSPAGDVLSNLYTKRS